MFKNVNKHLIGTYELLITKTSKYKYNKNKI